MEEERRILRDSGPNYDGVVVYGEQIVDTEPGAELRLELNRYGIPDEKRNEIRAALMRAMVEIVPLLREAA